MSPARGNVQGTKRRAISTPERAQGSLELRDVWQLPVRRLDRPPIQGQPLSRRDRSSDDPQSPQGQEPGRVGEESGPVDVDDRENS